MNKKDHHEGVPDRDGRQRNWRHIHHSPLFWIGVVLFVAVAALYLL